MRTDDTGMWSMRSSMSPAACTPICTSGWAIAAMRGFMRSNISRLSNDTSERSLPRRMPCALIHERAATVSVEWANITAVTPRSIIAWRARPMRSLYWPKLSRVFSVRESASSTLWDSRAVARSFDTISSG